MEEEAQIYLGPVAAAVWVNLETGFQSEVDSLISMLTLRGGCSIVQAWTRRKVGALKD